LFMLETPFHADDGWLGLVTGISTGEEGRYCKDCVAKNGGGHGVSDHIYGDRVNEETIYEVVNKGYVLGFESGTVGKDPLGDRPRGSRVIGQAS